MRQTTSHSVLVEVTEPISPPHWALLERELLRAQRMACEAFFARYFDERGYLRCIPRWGGDDGPDDAAENLLNWTLLHALGALDTVLALYKKGWEGHLRQYTEAKTVEVPMARDGMYYREFPVMFDWFHHGEGYSAFLLQGLSDPYDRQLCTRTQRYAGFYMGEDPQAPNYGLGSALCGVAVRGDLPERGAPLSMMIWPSLPLRAILTPSPCHVHGVDPPVLVIASQLNPWADSALRHQVQGVSPCDLCAHSGR